MLFALESSVVKSLYDFGVVAITETSSLNAVNGCSGIEFFLIEIIN